MSDEETVVKGEDQCLELYGVWSQIGEKPHNNVCSHDKPMFGARKCLRNLQGVSFLWKFFSNQSFWCVCKTF